MATVLVCGSREWTDRATIKWWLSRLPRGVTVVHGAARGADSLAGEVAAELGLEVRAYPADWKADGKAAGPIRNQKMLNAERPARVIAFTHALTRGTGAATRPTGTTDCLMRAVAMGIPCTIVPSRKR